MVPREPDSKPMAALRDSFTLLRERIRWRIAVLMCVFGLLMMIVLGVLNARSGRADSVWLSIVVFGALLACLMMLVLAPRGIGGQIYFWLTAAILIYLPWFGYEQNRTFHYWAYVFPPVLFFLMRPLPALIGMSAFGVYACVMITPFMAPIDVARVGLSYFLLVGFLYTYAVLEEQAAKMLRYHSDHDPLTNCLNRRTFNETLQAIEAAPGEHPPCAFLLIDVDRFKSINDARGHLVGDRVITQVAATLGRELDPGVGLYRYGGEEFAVLLPAADDAAAMRLAERLRAAVEKADFGELRVTVSIGASTWAPAQGPVAVALDAADAALYAAKRGGRNRVESAAALDNVVERRRQRDR
jgi:diguanylate cyclase (GGDEF)-like protein